MKDLKVAILYPEYLNINGDKGNILMLKQQAEANNVAFTCDEINIKTNFNSKKYDFFYLGGMPDEFNPIVTEKILLQKDDFVEIKESKKTLLGVGFGYQILGLHYNFLEQRRFECLGILNCFTMEKEKRHAGNVTSRMSFMQPNYLVGFENHRGSTYLNNGTLPLSYVDIGFGNNGSDKTEGARVENIFGTYLTGPLLPRNIYFTDYLLKITLENKYNEEFTLIDEDDSLEEAIHNDFINIKY